MQGAAGGGELESELGPDGGDEVRRSGGVDGGGVHIDLIGWRVGAGDGAAGGFGAPDESEVVLAGEAGFVDDRAGEMAAEAVGELLHGFAAAPEFIQEAVGAAYDDFEAAGELRVGGEVGETVGSGDEARGCGAGFFAGVGGGFGGLGFELGAGFRDGEGVNGEAAGFAPDDEGEAVGEKRLEHAGDTVFAGSGGDFGVDLVAVGFDPGGAGDLVILHGVGAHEEGFEGGSAGEFAGGAGAGTSVERGEAGAGRGGFDGGGFEGGSGGGRLLGEEEEGGEEHIRRVYYELVRMCAVGTLINSTKRCPSFG